MSMFKKATAFLLAAGIASSCAACGYNTVNALTVDGVEIPAGVYIYYASNAYNTALSKLQAQNAELDTNDKDAVKAQTIDGKDVTTWIIDEATKECTKYAVVEKKFDELGLTLGEEELSNLNMMKDYYWQSSKDMMEKNGISEASFEKVATSSYKSDAIFKYYYAVGGQEGVTDEDLYNYYKDNTMRAEYLTISLKDGEGNLLKSDGKKEMMEMTEGYRDRLEAALAEGGVKAVQEEMAKIREEYQAYQDSLTADKTDAEPESEEETSAETTEAATTETTEDASAETTEDTSAETTEASETTAETKAEADTTEAETVIIEETSPVLNAPKSEETTEAAETGDTTEAETASTSDEDATDAETAVASDADETDDEDSTEAETEEETEKETDAVTAEDVGEDDLAESAEDDEEENPYANESIINIVHEEDYDDPSSIYYNPTENVYKKLLSIGAKDYGKPYIVEEDESYYLVVRYDIEERMVANDLWNDGNKDSAMYNLHDKDFDDLMDGWVNATAVVRNEAAYKRYDPFKFDFT